MTGPHETLRLDPPRGSVSQCCMLKLVVCMSPHRIVWSSEPKTGRLCVCGECTNCSISCSFEYDTTFDRSAMETESPPLIPKTRQERHLWRCKPATHTPGQPTSSRIARCMDIVGHYSVLKYTSPHQYPSIPNVMSTPDSKRSTDTPATIASRQTTSEMHWTVATIMAVSKSHTTQ